MRYWWVNQNQTYRSELQGGFLWSPKTNTNGARNQFYDNMCEVAVGDIIFSFCDTKIKAIGIATGKSQSAPKPDFGSAGNYWQNEGWLVSVKFSELDSHLRPKDYIEIIRPHLPNKYSPLQENGNGLQSVYLAAVPDSMAKVLIQLIGQEYNIKRNLLQVDVDEFNQKTEEDNDEIKITDRTDIGQTTKEQLIHARRGQGIFKMNVQRNEKKCRITHITDPQHLRASHIKPWKDSSDQEKLNGHNGLLLAPHIDHLFDRGYISFSDNGDMLISPQLDPHILTLWGIKKNLKVGNFHPKQTCFLQYHREFILKK